MQQRLQNTKLNESHTKHIEDEFPIYFFVPAKTTFVNKIWINLTSVQLIVY